MEKVNNNEKFLIVRNIKSFIMSLEGILLTFPKKDFISRTLIYNDSLELLELVVKANYENNLELKHNYQIAAMAKINKVDFYLERAYKLKYISERQLTNKLNELLKIVIGNKRAYKITYIVSKTILILLTALSSILILYIHNIALVIILAYLWYLEVIEIRRYNRRKNIEAIIKGYNYLF